MISRVIRAGLVCAALSASAPAAAQTYDGARIYVIDGDTVRLPGGEIVRLHAIDAAEIGGARCEAELTRGLAAKARLRALLNGEAAMLTRCEPATGRCVDRYGRTLGALATRAGDVAQILIAEGHALPWRAGAAAAASRRSQWCGPGKDGGPR